MGLLRKVIYSFWIMTPSVFPFIFLFFSSCVIFHYSSAQISYSVSGGQGNAPYYTFSDNSNQTPDFSTLTLYRGETLQFTDMGVSSTHPFMIGESSEDDSLSFITGGPLNGSGGVITVTIPADFDSTLYYFCTNHAAMIQEFNVKSSIRADKNYKFFNFDWNDTSNSFMTNEVAFPRIRVFSGNNYIFINDSAESLRISDNLDNQSLTGSTVFNNDAIGPENYLVFSPKIEHSNTTFYYYTYYHYVY